MVYPRASARSVTCSRGLAGMAAGLFVVGVSAQAQAAPTYYDDLAVFEAAIQFSVTDDYSDPAYVFNQSNLVMSAVIGETDYETTGFDNWNLITGGGALYYCAGCNGSFQLSFTTTSVGDELGVYGVGADIRSNSVGTPYYAFITFANGATENILLPAAGTWWGVTAPERIESIHFGLSMGVSTTGGSFGIDNLIVAEGETDCGDGELNDDEDCDDAGESATCNANCTLSACGDDIANIAAGEECDDEGESDECDIDCTAVVCGDLTVNVSAGEECDEAGETADCDLDCTESDCGDGYINKAAGEVCDGGGVTPTCDPDCTEVECGDAILNLMAGEICDEGGETLNCNADCTEAECGDGVLNVSALEECDDGNVLADDGCAADCTVEMGGSSEDTGGGSDGDTGTTTGAASTGGGASGGLDTSGGGEGQADESGAGDTGIPTPDPGTGTGTGGTGVDDAGLDEPETGCSCTSSEGGDQTPAALFTVLLGLIGFRRRSRG